jgi:GntR family transcriptional repressor for pyruvate dehydrogenase complex
MSEQPPVFAPVRMRRAFEAVCDQIRQQVADGVLSAGDRLPSERELSEQFGVSRSGVREALRSLEMAGMVEALTGINGGFYIKQAHPEGITQAVRDMVALNQVPVSDVTEARILLMSLAIRLACGRATEEDFRAIEDDIERFAVLVKQGKPVRDSALITEFYRLIARATHNEVIVMLIDALSEILRTLIARLDAPPQSNVVQVRRKVLRLMREGDADKASAALAKHLNALNLLLEAMEAKKAPR